MTSVVPVTASMLDVGPVEANDVGGGGMVVAGLDEVDKLFAVVGSEVICWFSVVKPTAVGPAKMMSDTPFSFLSIFSQFKTFASDLVWFLWDIHPQLQPGMAQA